MDTLPEVFAVADDDRDAEVVEITEATLRKALRVAYRKGLRRGSEEQRREFDTLLERMTRLKELGEG